MPSKSGFSRGATKLWPCCAIHDIRRCSLEHLESLRQPVAGRSISVTSRNMQRTEVQALERLKHWAVDLQSEALGDTQLVVWIDAYQVRTERGVMDFRKRDALGTTGCSSFSSPSKMMCAAPSYIGTCSSDSAHRLRYADITILDRRTGRGAPCHAWAHRSARAGQ